MVILDLLLIVLAKPMYKSSKSGIISTASLGRGVNLVRRYTINDTIRDYQSSDDVLNTTRRIAMYDSVTKKTIYNSTSITMYDGINYNVFLLVGLNLFIILMCVVFMLTLRPRKTRVASLILPSYKKALKMKKIIKDVLPTYKEIMDTR
jgi:hypothetical protein